MLLGCVLIVMQVARVNGPAVFARVRRKRLRASKDERSTAFTRLSGREGKRQKRKAVAELKVTVMYIDVVITVDAMVDAILRSHEISAP